MVNTLSANDQAFFFGDSIVCGCPINFFVMLGKMHTSLKNDSANLAELPIDDVVQCVWNDVAAMCCCREPEPVRIRTCACNGHCWQYETVISTGELQSLF